jgi:ubiquitin-activating enzyme E1
MYFLNNNSLPELNNLDQVEKLINLSENYYKVLKQEFEKYLKIKEKRKISLIEFDKNYLIKVFRWCKSQINPICAFLGGIVSQEAIKITGKYTPIYQWLRFDFFETVENLPNDVNRNLLNCRYDDQIAIFGQELQEKLKNLNIFMIGAGALGCEYIKNFGLMGISCNKGKIIVTDNDNISLSNLNRQFLFHKNDIGENSSKSFVAKREAL